MNVGIFIRGKQTGCEGAKDTDERTQCVCALYSSEASESLSVQERKINKKAHGITHLSVYKSIPVHATFALQFLNPFCAGDPILSVN